MKAALSVDEKSLEDLHRSYRCAASLERSAAYVFNQPDVRS